LWVDERVRVGEVNAATPAFFAARAPSQHSRSVRPITIAADTLPPYARCPSEPGAPLNPLICGSAFAGHWPAPLPTPGAGYAPYIGPA
jgi:hypothetical protein